MKKVFVVSLLSLTVVWASFFFFSSNSSQRMIFSADQSTYFTDYLRPRAAVAYSIVELYGKAPNTWTRGQAGLILPDLILRPFAATRRGAVAFLLFSSLLFVWMLVSFSRARGCFCDCWGKLMVVALSSSWIFMRTIERGNFIFVAVACSLVFLMWFDSKSSVKRAVAAIALGAAVAMKISPVFLGFMYLIDPVSPGKGWRGIDWTSMFLSGAVAIALVFIPFAIGGEFVENLTLFREAVARESGLHPSTWGLHGMLDYGSGVMSRVAPWVTIGWCKLSTVVLGLAVAGCLVLFTIYRKSSTKSDRLFLLTAVMLVLCLNSMFYLGLMLFPSLILWLKEVDDRGNPTWLEYVQLILWVLMLMPFQIVIAGRATTMFVTFFAFWSLILIKVWTCFRRCV